MKLIIYHIYHIKVMFFEISENNTSSFPELVVAKTVINYVYWGYMKDMLIGKDI